MARNERIPARIRREINRIGPGRYVDPETGRVYIDSADMDGAFETMQDDVRAADEERDRERRAEARRPKPPPEVEALAARQLARHTERLRGVREQREDSKRLKHLRGVRAWKRSIGEELDDERLAELRALEEAEMAHERKRTPMPAEVVSGKYETMLDERAALSDRQNCAQELVDEIDHHGAAANLPEGVLRREFEEKVGEYVEALCGRHPDPRSASSGGGTPDSEHGRGPTDPAGGETSGPTDETREEPTLEGPVDLLTKLHGGPFDGRTVLAPKDWAVAGLLFVCEDEDDLSYSDSQIPDRRCAVYRFVVVGSDLSADARFDRWQGVSPEDNTTPAGAGE